MRVRAIDIEKVDEEVELEAEIFEETQAGKSYTECEASFLNDGCSGLK